MRKIGAILLCILFSGVAAGCGGYEWESDIGEELEVVDLNSAEELYHIRITAGDMVLSGILYDNQTARAFAEMLPMTVGL